MRLRRRSCAIATMIRCQTLSTFCCSDCVGKKAIQTLSRVEISKAGKVARRQYTDQLNLDTDRLNLASCSIEGTTKAGPIDGYELRATMQLKLAIQETPPPNKINVAIEHHGFWQPMRRST